MSDIFQCQNCLQVFSSSQRLDSHIKRKNKCESPEETKVIVEPKQEIICQYCRKTFTRKDSLNAHFKRNRCLVLKNRLIQGGEVIETIKEEITKIKHEFDEKGKKMEKQIAELKVNPKIINNNLQIVCVGDKD